MSDAVSRLKSELAAVIAQRIAGWRRADIAVRLGAALSSVSRLRAASVDRFTLDALIRYANRLGYDVELRLHPRTARERSETASRITSD
jgi:predicted XRE-type DNA-binding protein